MTYFYFNTKKNTKGIASDSNVEIFNCDYATYNCLGLQKIGPEGFSVNNIVMPPGSDIVLIITGHLNV